MISQLRGTANCCTRKTTRNYEIMINLFLYFHFKPNSLEKCCFYRFCFYLAFCLPLSSTYCGVAVLIGDSHAIDFVEDPNVCGFSLGKRCPRIQHSLLSQNVCRMTWKTQYIRPHRSLRCMTFSLFSLCSCAFCAEAVKYFDHHVHL